MAAYVEQHRPRSKSMLSFGSTRSHRSNGSAGKIDWTETPKEKSARRMTSKADPTMAMTEAQPATVAHEKSTIESIRSIQHRDVHGNIITDPDRSNPTRPRLERPLDTIRSFEAAIDGNYQRRNFNNKPEHTDSPHVQSRRSSYYQGYSNGSSQRRFPGDNNGYYGNRLSYNRPDSYIDNYSSQPVQHHQGRKFGPRTHSDPVLHGKNSQGVYPTHGYQQSYDTVTSSGSGAGSGGTDQWGNSTDPSSENSSVDKIQQAPKQPDLAEIYRFPGFGGAPQLQVQGPIMEELIQGAPAYGQPGYGQSQGRSGLGYAYQGNDVAPPPPPHAPPYVPPKDNGPRVPIKLGVSNGVSNNGGRGNNGSRSDVGGKRTSWIKRRFSKKD